MSNFLSRLLIMLIFFPLLFVLIFVFNFAHFLLFNILVSLVAGLATAEIVRMFIKKGIPIFRFLPPIASTTLPLAFYLQNIGIMPDWFFDLWIASILLIIFASVIFFQKLININEALPAAGASIFSLFYPSYFLVFIVKISTFSSASIALLYFLSAVFFNDIAAYCFGKLAHGKTQLNLIISPNKTLIGFIAGFLTSVATVVIYSYLFDAYFYLPLPSALLLGALLGIATIIGDLFESALKRSCQLKDSGVIMGGRGGLMDAIDSLLFSAPLFYYLFYFLAQPR